MSDFSVVVGVTWAALAGFGLDFFSVYLETNPYTRIPYTPPSEDHYEDKQVQ
jgi:hypothetical protein